MTPSRSKQTGRFRFVGNHVDDLHDGRPLEPGLFYELTPAEQEEPHNRRHIESGQLIATDVKDEGSN